MRRGAIVVAAILLASCSTQLTAHTSSDPKRYIAGDFKPVTVPKSYIIIDSTEMVHRPIIELQRINPPSPKKKIKIKTVVTVHATTSPKKYALKQIGATQFSCLDPLWDRESHWNYKAQNRNSGAYGIPQALPGSKMAWAGADWRTNPITQVKWGLHYINNRYGSACKAWSFWRSHHWY